MNKYPVMSKKLRFDKEIKEKKIYYDFPNDDFLHVLN